MSRRPPKAFDVRRFDRPILDVAAQHSVATGIAYGIQWPGLVPEFEEYEAMVEAHHNTVTWQAAGWRERARAVAWLRLHRLIELHGNDAAHDAARRRPRE